MHRGESRALFSRLLGYGGQIRAALDYVVGGHVGGARSSPSETRLINTVATALVGEEELTNPTKVRGKERSVEDWFVMFFMFGRVVYNCLLTHLSVHTS